MEKEKGQKPWNTANYAAGKLRGISKMLLSKRSIYEVFCQVLGIKKLVEKLFYQQLVPEFRISISQRAQHLLLSKNLTALQRETIEYISQNVFTCPFEKLTRFSVQLSRIEDQPVS